MFNFFKKKKYNATEIIKYEKDSEQNNGATKIGAGYAIAQTVQQATQQAAQKFAKPNTYNRYLYDSGLAKKNAKIKLFDKGEVIDPYNGNKLFLTRNEAEQYNKNKWQEHLAETDHIKPLKQIYEDTKNNLWNTNNDIQLAANSDDNLQVISRQINNAKRSRTNEEFVNDESYLLEKGIELTEEGKQRAIRDGQLAEQSINKQLKHSAIKNIAQTGHDAGIATAQNAGITTLTMSGILNLVAVIKGEKKSEDAIADTVTNGGKAAVTGYLTGSSLTVVSHSLSNSSSKFIQGLVKSNVPGKVITTVTVMGDTLAKWSNKEITTEQCLIELGDKGLNLATASYSMAVGQALIPIPVVGGAIGALVGSMLTSSYYNNLIQTLQIRELEHQERMRIIEECKEVAEQTKVFRLELESYLNSYFKEYRDCFDDAISSMHSAYQLGDADWMIASANKVTRKLGGRVYYDTVDEFKDFLDSDTIDIL